MTPRQVFGGLTTIVLFDLGRTRGEGASNHAIISRNINKEGYQHVIERCASIVFAWIGRWGP